MWFQHLNEIQDNRKKGAKKAPETRRGNVTGKKKKKQNVGSAVVFNYIISWIVLLKELNYLTYFNVFNVYV